LGAEGEKTPVTQAGCLRLAADTALTLGAEAGALLTECWIEWFPITISSPLNGGLAFAGKSGRSTANACDANTMETIMIAAAHFMSGGLNRLRLRDKKNFCVIAVISASPGLPG
jgi:hypothetical protein